jgi:hypothetical protein
VFSERPRTSVTIQIHWSGEVNNPSTASHSNRRVHNDQVGIVTRN